MKILLTTDFTKASDHAIEYIKALEKSWETEQVSYVLVHGYKPLVPYTKVPSIPVIKNKDLEEKLIEKFKLTLDFLKKDLNVTSHYFEQGALPGVISDVVEKELPDLIVMGTREKDTLERMTIGTNTLEVAMNTDVPVLAVPKEALIKQPGKITFASDMKVASSPAVEFLIGWTALNKSKLQLLHIAKEGNPEGVKKEMVASDLHQKLGGADHEHHALIDDDIFDGIKKFVEKHQPEMLVSIPDERSFFEKMFSNTATEKMAYHLRIPLLILS